MLFRRSNKTVLHTRGELLVFLDQSEVFLVKSLSLLLVFLSQLSPRISLHVGIEHFLILLDLLLVC